MNPDDIQVGGNHYKTMGIQPWEFFEANFTKEEFIAYLKMEIISYLMRNKNGLEDIKKARHIIDKLIEVESKGRVCKPLDSVKEGDKLLTKLVGYDIQETSVISQLYYSLTQKKYMLVILTNKKLEYSFIIEKEEYDLLDVGLSLAEVRKILS